MEEDIYIHTKNGSLYGKCAGDPASSMVVGLHGWSQRNGWQTWQPLMQPLATAGFYIVSVDMPGWGKSQSWEDSPLSSERAVEVVLAILDSMNRPTATLMGKSWGGGIALEFALDFPERVNKLVLTAPAFRDTTRLQTLIQPVLLAWAMDDPVIPVKYAAEFEDAVPDIEVTIYKDGGHSAATKNASDFAQRAIRFLKGQAQGTFE